MLSIVNRSFRSPAVARALPCVSTAARFLSTQAAAPSERVVIMGAAGRDFHDAIVYWTKQPNVEVKAFTATQIPGIEGRQFPADMCNNDQNGSRYPDGIPIYAEKSLEEVIESTNTTTCALAYSDLSYDTVQKLAARVNAAGAKFVQLPPHLTMVESTKPVVSVCASRTGVGKCFMVWTVQNCVFNCFVRTAHSWSTLFFQGRAKHRATSRTTSRVKASRSRRFAIPCLTTKI